MDHEILKKLRYKQGPAAVLNAPEGYTLGIETADQLEGTFDFIQLFVKSAEEVRAWIPQVVPALNDDALFWITYPKQSSKVKTDINRDIIWQIIQEISDYRLVSNVSVDETWSALRARHQDKVKKK